MYMLHVIDALFFFFNDTATTEIYTLSLHDALPICRVTSTNATSASSASQSSSTVAVAISASVVAELTSATISARRDASTRRRDRKSTRLNSSHANISYAVFCLKKKNNRLNSLHYNT